MLGYVLGVTLVLSVLCPLLITDVFADSFTVNLNRQLFNVGDSLIVSGEIVNLGMPVIAMSIYDPDGKIASANNLEISSEKTFSKTIVLESPVYEKIGEYQIKLEYGKAFENSNFILEDDSVDSSTSSEFFEDHITLHTEKKQYSDNDIVKIHGTVSVLTSPSVLIGIYDPIGMPIGFYFGVVDPNLEFSTDFLVKDGVNFRVDGTYSVKAHYEEIEIVSFFDYSKDPKLLSRTKLSPKKLSPKKLSPKKLSPKKLSPKKLSPKKLSPKKLSPKKLSPEEAVAEEAVAEEAVAEEAVAEEAVAEEAVAEEAVAEEAVAEEAVAEEAVAEEAVAEEAVAEETNVLSVNDVETGMSLNEINLKCNSGVFDDIISYYDGMGPALYRLCDFDNALIFFNESLLNNPDDVAILVNKGSTLGQLGYFSEAIIYYDYAIDIDPNFLPAINNKANALANLNQLNSAILLYDEVLAKDPNYLSTQKNLMIVQSLTDNHSESHLGSISQHESYSNSSMFDNAMLMNSEKQKSNTFFDDVSVVFSTLGSSLFDFLN